MGFISPKRFSYYKKDNVKNFPGRPGNAHKLYGIGSLVISLIILFAGSSCIRLDPSLYRFTPAMLAPDANVHAKFRAYSATNGISFEYDSKADAWTQINYTGPAGTLVSVAKTTNGFVGLHFTAASPTMVIYTSADGKTWTEVKNVPGVSTGKVAACGDNVVIAYPYNSSWELQGLISSDGGNTFGGTPVTVFPVAVTGYSYSIYDLQCDNSVFHVSASDGMNTVNNYKYSEDNGVTWSAGGSPTGAITPLSRMAINGDTILGLYATAGTTFSRSIDRGLNWTGNVSNIAGSIGDISYHLSTGYYYAPYVDVSDNCIFARTADNGSTWDASPFTIPGCAPGGYLSHVASGDSAIIVVGYQNTQPVIVLSTDDGATFNDITLSVTTASIGGFTDLLLYYE